jgi:outer membrane protein TolC
MMMMQDIAVGLGHFRKACVPVARVIVLACASGLGSCAVGPNFTRPTAPSAARYTGDTLRGEDASASGTVQHIAVGHEIEDDWWSLFGSDAIDQLVKQAVAHNRSLAASAATLKQAQELALAQAGAHGTRKWPSPPMSAVSSTGRSFWAELEYLPLRTSPSGHRELHARLYRGVARSVEEQYALAEVERHQLDAACRHANARDRLGPRADGGH